MIIPHFALFRKMQMGRSGAQFGGPRCYGVVDCDSYYEYGVKYHLEGTSPLCRLYNVDDELIPFNQSVRPDLELTRAQKLALY